MRSDQEKGRIKQPYEKPRLRAIELAAGEVLAYGCKTDDSSYLPPNVDQPIGCGLGNRCSVVGS
jgi:hypothetical protein